MTEFTGQFRDDELDAEDALLRDALTNHQTMVADFLRRTGKSVNDLTEDEQQKLIQTVNPHLKFELKTSEDLYVGMPLVVRGPGAFLMTDQDGFLMGAQVTIRGDVLSGTVSDIQAYPVPTREIVLTTDPSDALPTYDQSLSAVIIIENAAFNSLPSADGTFQITHDLGSYRVVVPAVYGMDTRVADVAV